MERVDAPAELLESNFIVGVFILLKFIMSRPTRSNPGGGFQIPENLPEEEGDLRKFIEQCFAKSQAEREKSQAELMDKIAGLEDTIESMKEQHQLEIAKLRSEQDNKVTTLHDQIEHLEKKVAKEKTKRKKQKLAGE